MFLLFKFCRFSFFAGSVSKEERPGTSTTFTFVDVLKANEFCRARICQPYLVVSVSVFFFFFMVGQSKSVAVTFELVWVIVSFFFVVSCSKVPMRSYGFVFTLVESGPKPYGLNQEGPQSARTRACVAWLTPLFFLVLCFSVRERRARRG